MQKLIILFAGLFLSCRFAAAEVPSAQRFDHTNPVHLNELALQKVKQGELGTAIILLERASLLAPHEARIQRNLQVLRAWQNGNRLDPRDDSRAAAVAGIQSPTNDLEVSSVPAYPLWSRKQDKGAQ
jgi:Flp pilus assembly protein TadD